ncbi:MAG: hypothetical protein A3J38_10415 [Gammaproteobacteria bacterium RIFCSPHIGHO2_12_FULL_45_9]|nr:MAG: hypothetical protein A3J38_10415 [Gammaproteobacteria bacterium RIFCSPHIGHO2_12_FULL_45_9]
MPHLTQLVIEGFRNLSATTFSLSPTITVLTGGNGAGKTSVLEALYYLAHGRSFRSHEVSTLVQTGQPYFRISTQGMADGLPLRLGVERQMTGGRVLRYNGETVRQQLALTQALPLVWVSSDSQTLFLEGPQHRRAFLDWLVFHVEPSFPSLWQQAQHLLKQRNAALKAKAPRSLLLAWETEWIPCAEQIDQLRRLILTEWLTYLTPLLQTFLDISDIAVHYYPGWPESSTLIQALHRNLARDNALGYTSVGPHRADLRITTHGIPVADHLSQGQLKQLAYAFALSQGIMLSARTSQTPIFLLDDVPSELDTMHCQRFFDALGQLKAQIIMTGIELGDFASLHTTEAGITHIPLQAGEVQNQSKSYCSLA